MFLARGITESNELQLEVGVTENNLKSKAENNLKLYHGKQPGPEVIKLFFMLNPTE